ncbi:hypothetical protein F4778DRAFT_353130 [Xylariomycetidae sp. FL2044]|nr:hypothetical protein F4778DRAFT_353130 [Xylariomycetidae sp. FL2044]
MHIPLSSSSLFIPLLLLLTPSPTLAAILLPRNTTTTTTHTYPPCGGHTISPPQTCDAGYTCVDDPRKPSKQQQAVDLPGICVPVRENKAEHRSCGGFAGLECMPGVDVPTVCVDWPGDACDPQRGGADCEGFCMFPLPEGEEGEDAAA